MAVPTNTTALTAMVISSLPFSVTQDVADQPKTTELWYTYTAVNSDRVIGMVPYADVTGGYLPKLYVYTGPASAPVGYHVFGSTTRAAYVPVDDGVVYLFRVTQAGATTPLGQSLTFKLQSSTSTTIPANALIACGEDQDVNTPVVSGTTDNTVLTYLSPAPGFAVSSQGAEMDDGTVCCDDDGEIVDIWTAALERVYHALPSYFDYSPNAYGTDGSTRFYLGYAGTSTDPLTIRTLTASGGETADVWTLPSDSNGATIIAPSRDNTKLYYGGATGAVPAGILHVYDLVNDTALPDLVPAIGSDIIQGNILVLQDNTILVGYTNVTTSWYINRYNTAGTLLNTYDLSNSHNDGFRAATDDPVSFWVKLLSSDGPGNRVTFRRYKVSDGTTISEATYDSFNNGPANLSYRPTYTTIEDVPLFGLQVTCTFFVTHNAPAPSPPSIATRVDPIRRLRQAPHLWDGKSGHRLKYPGFQLLVESGAPRDTDQPLTFWLQWSDDGGHTWSNLHELQGSNIGQYKTRFWWRRLGQSRDRVFRVINSDDAKIVLIDALLVPDPTEGAN